MVNGRDDDGYRWCHGGGVCVHSFTARRVFSQLGRFAQDFGELTNCRDFGSYGERRCKERRREREVGKREKRGRERVRVGRERVRERGREGRGESERDRERAGASKSTSLERVCVID